MVRGSLKSTEGSSQFILGAFAHLGHDGLHVYVLDKLEQYNHNYAIALGLLEIELGKGLRSKFRTVTLHTIPMRGLRDEELGYYRSGVNSFRFMPTSEEHLEQARSNEQLTKTLRDGQSHFDWSITISLYSALHYLESYSSYGQTLVGELETFCNYILTLRG